METVLFRRPKESSRERRRKSMRFTPSEWMLPTYSDAPKKRREGVGRPKVNGARQTALVKVVSAREFSVGAEKQTDTSEFSAANVKVGMPVMSGFCAAGQPHNLGRRFQVRRQ